MVDVRRSHFLAMDALRAGAALLVVALHAAVPYMDVQFPEVLWAIHDRSASRVFDWVFLWCNGVSMPLFFLLAGFFAAMVCDERGPGEFVWQRTKRILLPFIAACILILPVTFYVWAGGWLLAGRCTMKEILRVQFGPSIQPNLYGPAHLWFLEYLFLLCLLFAAVAPLRTRNRRSVGVTVPALFVGATALILWMDPGAPVHFHNSFVPNPGRFLYYAVFFLAGVWLLRSRHRMVGSTRLSALHVGVSLVAFCGVAWLLPSHLGAELEGWPRLLLVTTMVLFAWCSIFGFVGLAQHLFDHEYPAVSYVAAASYWIYLVHFPVVGAAQIGLSTLPGPAVVKYAAVFGTAMCVSLFSYEHVVRHSFIGRWLDGTRRVMPSAGHPRRASARAVAEAG
jgi:glucan biosynthesis protein C